MPSEQDPRGPSIIVHGGAGDFDALDEPGPRIDGCRRAARVGYELLLAGGSALDAVTAAVKVLEDDPVFNAGLGSALNVDGEVETDASIMNGADLGAGAVAALKDVKNPVELARLVMERTPHVFLVSEGARAFAVEQGVPLLPPGALVTAEAQQKWRRALEDREKRVKSHGTVGAVARDRRGHLSAATSTGGTVLKRPGRVGDTPLIGCGTYANDLLGACSATGLGEAIIKATLARRVVDGLSFASRSRPVSETAAAAVAQLTCFGGNGGVIAIDPVGRVGFAFNSQRMARAWVDREGREGSGFGPQ